MITRPLSIATLALCLGTPAVSQSWTATATLSAPLAQEYRMQGDSFDQWAEQPGDLVFSAYAFLSETDPTGTPCTDADQVLFDIYFGYSARVEIQMLFDAEALVPGQWRAVNPISYYNAGTSDDTFLVNIEVPEGSTIDLAEMTCQPDGTVDVTFDYAFTGGSVSGKGPDSLTVSGRVVMTGLSVDDYDEY